MSDKITAYIPVEELDSSVEAGDMVEYADEKYGVVTEKYTDNFEFPGGEGPESDLVEVEASEDSPTYIVSKQESGIEPMNASDFDVVDRSEVFDDEDPDPKKDLDKVEEEMSATLEAYENAEDIHTLAGIDELREYDVTGRTAEELVSVADVPGVSRNDVGQAPWPESWRESDKPARLIALDAWADFNASHTGCVREMSGRIRRPNAFCGAFKDAILGYETWREGG